MGGLYYPGNNPNFRIRASRSIKNPMPQINCGSGFQPRSVLPVQQRIAAGSRSHFFICLFYPLIGLTGFLREIAPFGFFK